jgi:hypothetical protein
MRRHRDPDEQRRSIGNGVHPFGRKIGAEMKKAARDVNEQQQPQKRF